MIRPASLRDVTVDLLTGAWLAVAEVVAAVRGRA